MAVKRSRQNSNYGFPNPLSDQFPAPIVQPRDPSIYDQGEIGQTWVNTATNTIFTLTSYSNGGGVWTTNASSGNTFTDVTITGGVGQEVLTIDDGDAAIDNGDLSVSGATDTGTLSAGNTAITGTLGVTGATTLNGDLDVTGDITITGDWDVNSAASISITSTNDAAGAITLLVNGGTSETLVLQSAQGTGGDAITLDAVAGGITIQSALGAVDAISIDASDAAGGIEMDYGTGGMVVTGTNGDFDLVTGTGAINLGADAAAHTITMGNVTGATAVVVNSGTGGVELNSTGIGDIDINSSDDVTIDAAGLISLDAAEASNFTVSGAALDLTLESTAGSVIVNGGEAVADAIAIDASAGGFTVDGVLGSSVTVTGASEDLTLSSVGGSVNIAASEAAADAVVIDASAGGFTLDGVLGSGITVTGASEDLNLTATGGSINITASEAAADAIVLDASNAAGGIQINANGLVSVEANAATVASPTAASTQNFRVISTTFTGFTTAAAASQDFTINSDAILANSALFVQVTNLDASTNAAIMTLDGVTQAAGSIVVHTTNNGAGALGAGDNVLISVWVCN